MTKRGVRTPKKEKKKKTAGEETQKKHRWEQRMFQVNKERKDTEKGTYKQERRKEMIRLTIK